MKKFSVKAMRLAKSVQRKESVVFMLPWYFAEKTDKAKSLKAKLDKAKNPKKRGNLQKKLDDEIKFNLNADQLKRLHNELKDLAEDATEERKRLTAKMKLLSHSTPYKFTYRSLTSEELIKGDRSEAVEDMRNQFLDAVSSELTPESVKNYIENIEPLTVKPIFHRFISFISSGMVEPKMSRDDVVDFSKKRPKEFVILANKIFKLSDEGMDVGKL